MIGTENSVYAIIAHQGDDIFLVKFGFASIPYNRYLQLLPGIPFASVMLWTPAGSAAIAQKLEKRIQGHFDDRLHWEGWYRFSTDDKAMFYKGMAREFIEVIGVIPKWQQIFPYMIYEREAEKRKEKRERAIARRPRAR